MRLKNKVCVVTGSSSGIGEAIAREYAKEGARVVITYHTQESSAKQIAEEIGAPLVVHLDVRRRASIRAMYRAVVDECGEINVLVNNAGINRTADFDQQTDEEWNDVLDVNLSGPFRCGQEVLPHISDYGRIINIGSLSGEYGGPRTPSYACAKMGLMALTHNMARFLGHRGICVNTLSPGIIANEFAEKSMSPDVRDTALSLMLIKRFGRISELVGAAVFLASDESSYLTAQTISINGGAWVRS